MRPFLLLTIACLLVTAGPASAARKWQGPAVSVVLVGEPLTEAEMRERSVVPEQPFMIQRLSALKSVTLQSEVVIRFWHRTTRFKQGQKLFLASGADGFEVYCGAFDPGLFLRSGGAAKLQWACLRDTDADGVFDKGYWTPDALGLSMPSFGKVIAGPDIKVAYTSDAEADRFYFESSIQLAPGSKPNGPIRFLRHVRGAGEATWRGDFRLTRETNDNLTSLTVEGAWITVSGKDLPATADMDGALFAVVSWSASGVVIKPQSVPVGQRRLEIYDAY